MGTGADPERVLLFLKAPRAQPPVLPCSCPALLLTQWALGSPAQPQPTAPSPHLSRANSVPAYFYHNLTHIPDLVHPAELKDALCKKPAPLEEKTLLQSPKAFPEHPAPHCTSLCARSPLIPPLCFVTWPLGLVSHRRACRALCDTSGTRASARGLPRPRRRC